MHVCSSCISWFTTTAPVGTHDQQEGDPPGQIMEGDDQEEDDDPEGRRDVEERVEELESDGPEEQDQSMEHYSYSSGAASDAFEEEEDSARPRPPGGRDSEENLNTAVEESSSRSNTAQSDLVVSSRSTECRTRVFIVALVLLYIAVLLCSIVDRPCTIQLKVIMSMIDSWSLDNV